MTWSLKLMTAPTDVLDATTPGLVKARRVLAQAGAMELDLDKMIPTIKGAGQQLTVVPLMDGNGRTFRRGPEKLQVNVRVDDWTPPQWELFRRMSSSGQLFTFTPGYSVLDFWASSFAGLDSGGGLAEIGDSQAGQYIGRVADEFHASTGAELQGLVKAAGTITPKLVRGMTGNAILTERRNEQLVTTQTWTPQSGAIKQAGDVGNHPEVTTDFVFIGGGGGYIENTSLAAATVSQDYVAFVDVKGSGTLRLKAIHNTGATTVSSGDVVLTGQWQRLAVTWLQVGTSIDLRIDASAVGGVFAVASANVQRGKVVTDERSHMPDSTTLTANADRLLVSGDALPGGDNMTILVWVKMPATGREVQSFLMSYSQAGGAQGSLTIGTTNDLRASFGLDTNTHTGALSATPGDWVQVAVAVYGTGGGMKLQLFQNGAILGAADLLTPDHIPRDSTFYVGSDEGLTTPLGRGCQTPIDSFRIVAKQLSTAEILADYDLRTEAGVRTFLTWTQGRYFRLVGVPAGFRGPFTDSIVGDLVLEQVAHVNAGAL